jgi:hypothetical protein
VLTAAMAILFLVIGDPIWLIAAANFTYLIGIRLPSVAVWLVAARCPGDVRPYRAPRGNARARTRRGRDLGIVGPVRLRAVRAADRWWSAWHSPNPDRRFTHGAVRRPPPRRIAAAVRLQVKLTGAMLVVLILDGVGYLLAVDNLPEGERALMTMLSDIFVAVAHAHHRRCAGASRDDLAFGDGGFQCREEPGGRNASRNSRVAVSALDAGTIDGAHARVTITPVHVHARRRSAKWRRASTRMQRRWAAPPPASTVPRGAAPRREDQLTAANASLEQRVEDLRSAEENLSGIPRIHRRRGLSISANTESCSTSIPRPERVYGRPAADVYSDKKSCGLRSFIPD